MAELTESLARFAKMHGRTPQAATAWKRDGHLVMQGNLVLVESSNRRMKAARLGRFVDDHAAAPDHQPAPSTIKRKHKAGARQVDVPRDAEGAIDFEAPETFRSLDAFVELLMGGGYATAAEADTVKANALALTRLIEARKAAGLVIELEVAEQVLFEEFRAARDAWLNFPARVGTIMASDLGVDADRLIEALTTHVHQQLEDLGEPDADALEPDARAEA